MSDGLLNVGVPREPGVHDLYPLRGRAVPAKCSRVLISTFACSTPLHDNRVPSDAHEQVEGGTAWRTFDTADMVKSTGVDLQGCSTFQHNA